MYVEKTFQHMKATTTLPQTGKEQQDLARRHLIKAFLPLLQTAPNERRRWRDTKIDLLEMTHIVYRFADVKDDEGRAASFLWLVRRICANLHLPVPRNPYAPVSKGMLRKNVYQRPVLERYGWLLFEQNRPQPLQEWLDMGDHTHR